MKRAVLPALKACSVALLLASVLFPAPGNSFIQAFAASSRVTIDGKRFLRVESGVDDFTLLKKAFQNTGADPQGDFDTPPDEVRSPEIFSGRFAEAPPLPSPLVFPVPGGLIPDHSMQLESGSGPVRLLIGRMDRRGASVRTRLVADGWHLVETGHDPGRVRLLEKTTGKEKAIVCLDEAEGAFLLVGECDR